ncbi:hypothetical protein BG015_007469 [Linnemannia schmuckeri]|uniref:Arb2 domain-containing protein n=1 Tax=Linnemannia schmuckeri TaxID=64567 RepID=A0A9P5S6B2_9FUNG|nr:hypothetical protein BG015_007469 [Linnemannia schmuckeri]
MTEYKQEDEEWFQNMGWHFNRNDDFVDKHDKLQVILHEKLMQDYGFKKIAIPWDPNATFPRIGGRIPPDCPRVFATKDVHVNPKILIIVQGLGKVAPGQWARKLFTNGYRDQFDYASQIPYIERALHLGWAVILCDPNRAELASTSAPSPMSMWLGGGGSQRAGPRGRADHVRRVWEDLIRSSSAKCVMFVAFSAGTAATLQLFDTYRREFVRRVKAVVLLDGDTGSSHYRQLDGPWLFKNTKSFSQRGSGGSLRNAEEVDTDDHDSVPGVAVARVFEFLEKQHNRFMAQLPEEQYRWIRSLYQQRTSALGRGVTRILSSSSSSFSRRS